MGKNKTDKSVEGFWEKYIEASILDRGEILEKTALVDIAKMCKSKINEGTVRRVSLITIQGFIDDLIEFMYVKHHKEIIELKKKINNKRKI